MSSGFVRALVPVSALVLAATPRGARETHISPHTASRSMQAVVIRGTITDSATNQPLVGATVVVGSSAVRALSDQQGRYRLVIPDGYSRDTSVVLRALRIGYTAAPRTVPLTADSVTVDFKLQPVQIQLHEVVVTSAATSLKRQAAGNVIAPASQPARFGVNGHRERRRADVEHNTEAYDPIAENPFLATSEAPRSTFSIDVDHASYSNVRRFLNGSTLPPRDAVRVEELINYFPYELRAPSGDDPVAITTEVGMAPWNPTHRLVRIGLRGRPIETQSLPPNNLVFLIDVSGSMESEDKLPLLKSAFRLLVNELRPQDRVALVVYAGAAGLVLPPTPGSDKERILQAIDALSAGGSTAGGAGIRLAYDVARQHYVEGGNNRVILATDGDFNVGASSDAEMVQLIEERREQGTFLTVLGFGTGNIKDAKMEKLADKGNGHYAYVDNLSEARKVLVTEMGGTLVTVAKDVKLQVEFNPAGVAAYRLIGYENRLLRDEDFKDDRKDAGDLGAGHTVTALYEIIPPGAPDLSSVRRSDPLRYTQRATSATTSASDELLFVKLRYKQPQGRTSRELTHVVRDARDTRVSHEFTFAAAVAEFGMVLRDSPHKGAASMDSVVARATEARGEDVFGYRTEFIRLATRARDILARESVAVRPAGDTSR